MLGGVHIDLLVTVTLLFVSHSGTQCRAENGSSLVTLPEWRTNAEYVTQCVYNRQNNLICDWTRSQHRTADVAVNILESGPLGLVGEACLEFWYHTPVAANWSELRVFLKSSAGPVEIWNSPGLSRNLWRQVFVPLKIINSQTQVVLEGASTEGRITFNQIGVRTGPCGPQCESNTELWTDESTRCLCSAGQLSCSHSQCPEGQICAPQTQEISTSGICTIHSHTDCSTFDGVLFRFMAPCSYILAKSCSPTDALPMFSVEVVIGQKGNSSLPTVQQLNVDMGNLRLSLMKKHTQRVVVNGIWKKLPLSLGSGTVNIKSNPAAVVLATSFGLSVSFDSAGAIHIALPSTYSNEVCGLCGNFNHLRGDDFRKPDGTNAKDATDLAESWQTEQTKSSCETILVPHQCDPGEEAVYASEQYCGGLLSSSGAFSDCHSVVGAESYFRDCVVSMCHSHGDPVVLCETLQVYGSICHEAGVTIHTWRNSTFCSLQCTENSHYNSCADGCPEVCSSLDLPGSCGNCEEICECDSGFKLSGGKCVQAEDCGCWYKGKHYEKGTTFVEGECLQQCLCLGNNDMQCKAMQCAANEVCKVKDEVKDCFPFKPTTCHVYGDPHYITFDTMAYDFQGGCSYTLTTTCGEESSVQFTVIGHNMHRPLQNFTRSKLEAVSLQVEDFYITLNQSGKVYVQNSHVYLPYSSSVTYGSVRVYKMYKSIVLETTFGLRMIIDGQNRLFLQVDESYKYELCGLCGTYSGYQDDDFVTPGGQNTTDPFQFGDSWRVLDNKECVAVPNDPRLCDYDEETEAYNECNTLLTEVFEPCHESIHPSIYLNSCVYDYCATNGEQHTLCESLKSYATACQVAGVKLPPWQSGTACADLSTTSTPPTPTASTPDQTFCPVNCDFEKNQCGWEQLIQDSFDWTRHSGPTPSDMTGPNQDHTTGAGFYMYIEGNKVTHGDSARLLSSVCHNNGPLCLHFWYHMYGSATAMALNIYLLKNNKPTKVWSKMNNQGPEWHLGYIDINVLGPFQIIVEGIRGSNAESDVAIDDISIQFGSCSGMPGLVSGTKFPPISTKVLPSHPACKLDCSFNSNLCSWNQMITDAFDWTWQSGSTPTQMTGPSADHTGDGYYLYIEASNVTHGDTARLISSECFDSGPQCLKFWYHMYGSADTMGLHVYLLQNRLTDAIWWKRNNQGNMWHLAQVDITTTGGFQIIIEGRRGSNEESDVAIDDVKLYRGQCSDSSDAVTTNPPKPGGNYTAFPSVPVPTTRVSSITALPPIENITKVPTMETSTDFININNVTEAQDNRPPHAVCPLQCNFEHDLCQWSQLLADVFDWTRQSGPTPTLMTGPSSDHTSGGGHYLYIEGNSASLGDTARLISSECSDTGPQCLQFWYHMYGSADTMGLHVYLFQNRKADAVWRKRNDQGNMWHLAQVDFTTTGAFQIIFEGRIGSNDQSDVAIDDVSLHRGYCRDLAKPTTSAPKTLAPVVTEGPELPPANSSLATQQPTTSSKPPRPLTTTAATTHYNTQNQTKPSATTYPSNPDVSMTTRPDVPITTASGPQTTAKPYTSTTEHTGVETPAEPVPETTERPNTTQTPEQPATHTKEPKTTENLKTDGAQPPTTAQLQPSTTFQPPPPNKTEPQTTAQPPPSTTTRPQLPTTVQPQPSTTTTQPQTTPRPGPPTTVQPHPPTTATSKLPTTMQPTKTTPQPQTTRPQLPTTVKPQPPTTAKPQPSTTSTPQPQTTPEPEPPTTVQPQPPTTTAPQPQTTVKPQLTTSIPMSTTTSRPKPTKTARPQPTTTAKPQPPTERPQFTTTATQQSTTAGPKPPTTHVPTPSCPENSHYTNCIPACSPTCTHLNGPPHCPDSNSCVAGCECDDGFVKKWQRCVPIQECGCIDSNGTKYQFNEVWYTNHCSQKCECEEDDDMGKIDCDDKDECDGNAVCLLNDKGEYYCQPTGFSECTIKEDPEYKTFDKMKHDFEGKHSYVLVRTQNLQNNLPDVYIEGINTHRPDDDDDSHDHDDRSSEENHSRNVKDEDDDDNDEDDEDDNDDGNDEDDDESEEHEKHHRLREIKIRVYNQTVEFKRNRKLVVNGKKTDTPVSPTPGVKIREHSSRIYLRTDFGLSVEFDGHGRAEIILPRIYRRKVGGLCGNFDGQKQNDWMKPDGIRARSVQEFGESWRV